MPDCPNKAEFFINSPPDRYFYCGACRLSFPPYTWKGFTPVEVIASQNGITFNPKTVFNGKPILCQLFCGSCKAQYCGSWRNDWISKDCRKCGKGQVKPIISAEIWKIMFEPDGAQLN